MIFKSLLASQVALQITQTLITILSAMLDVLAIIVVVLADIQVSQALYGCLFFIQVSQNYSNHYSTTLV